MEAKKPILVEDLAIEDRRICLLRFSELAGKWVDDPEFDAIIALQRQIDWEKWR